jgi:predicted deacylase
METVSNSAMEVIDSRWDERFLGVGAAKGAATKVRVAIGEFNDGSPVTLPVMVVRGMQEGPTVYLQAGLHGDENTGIVICQKFLRELDPKSLSGTVVAVPVANVPAHLSRTRGFLHEERWLIDANRIFPGNRHGLLSERIASVLLDSFVCAADLTIDFHSALDGCDILPFVYLGSEASIPFAEAFGTELRYVRGKTLGTSDMSRSVDRQAQERGAVMFSAEMGESRRVSWHYVEAGVQGIRNVLAKMGMLDCPVTAAVDPRRFDRIVPVHSARGGGLKTLVDLGDRVTEGQDMALVYDIFGSLRDTVKAPTSGLVLRIMRLGNIGTGAEIAWIASA